MFPKEVDTITNFTGFSDDLFYNDVDDIPVATEDIEPTDEQLSAIANGKKTVKKLVPVKEIARMYMNDEEKVKAIDNDLSPVLYYIRKFAGGLKFVSKDICKCTCGAEYHVKDMYHKSDAYAITGDAPLHAFARRFDFATRCTCGTYLYGDYEEHKLPRWLLEGLAETSTPAKTETKPGTWKQLSFFDEEIYEAGTFFSKTDDNSEMPIVETMTIDLAGQEDTDLEKLSEVNLEISNFCKETSELYANNTYFTEVKSLKTSEITSVAKQYTVLNFARMNNLEKKVSVALLKNLISISPVSLTDAQKEELVRILARTTSVETEKEISSLSFLSADEVTTLISSDYKGLYDKLQNLIKTKMVLSKNCIWGKTK